MDTFITNFGFPLLGFALSASPWILGAAIGHHVTRHETRADCGVPISIGIGGYLGYLTLAALIWVCEQVAVNILNPSFVFAFAAIAWFYGLILAGTTVTARPSHSFAAVGRIPADISASRITDSSLLLSGLLLAALLLSAAFHHSLLPLHAWDTLDLWGPQAAEIIKLQSADQVFENRYYHPQTLSIILAWSAYSSALVSTATGQWPWFLSALSIALIVFGYSRRYGQSIFISALVAYVAATVPLLGNHWHLAGYGEIFVSTVMLGASALIDLAIKKRNGLLGVFGCLLAFSAVALKNTGPFYFVIILSSYLLVLVISRSKVFTFFLVASIGLVILYFFSVGISFQLITQKFSINPDEGQILFAGKLLTIISVELTQIADVLVTALFRNNSFGIMPHVFVVAALTSLLYRPLLTKQLAFVQLAIIIGICGITASLYTDYGFQHAVPNNDTGNSRFILPIMMLSVLLVAPSLRRLSKKP